MNKRQKAVKSAITKMRLPALQRKILYEIWKEVDDAHAEQIKLLRRDGIRLLNLATQVVVTLAAWHTFAGNPDVEKLRDQILKMRRTWQGANDGKVGSSVRRKR